MLAIHDIAGFRNDIRRIARRLADAGIAALAPALFDGAGPAGICVFRTLRDCQRREGAAFERIEAAQAHLAALDGINADRIGITGFCLGGGFALFYALRGGVRVCAPYYGATPKEADQLTGVCPVVAGFGELDTPFVDQVALGYHEDAVADSEKVHYLKVLLGLRHHPVIGRHHQNNYISHASSAGSHCREGFVAGCIYKSNLSRFGFYFVSCDVLRDSSGLTINYVC